MEWKHFTDRLGNNRIDGEGGYHAPCQRFQINKLPTDVYVVMNHFNNSPWISGMGFAFATEENYMAGNFTGILHYTFAAYTHEVNGMQNGTLSVMGGLGGNKIRADESGALIEAAAEFASFRPEYASCLVRTAVSIVRNTAWKSDLDELALQR